MSHISRIRTQMKEKEYLLKAIQDLGYTYEEGNLTLTGFGNLEHVDIKIPLRMSFDIGFRMTTNGYEIIADWWGVRKVNQKEFTAALYQRYAYHAARASLEQQGFSMVSEENQADGQIRLVLRRVN
jgi:hypothetical protein